MNTDQRIARRRYHGNLNDIPLWMAYDFELRYIIENDPAEGFRGSRARIAAARQELDRRELQVADAFTPPDPFSRKA